jgi:formate-dependent nitrite reductase membrane component NrfD
MFLGGKLFSSYIAWYLFLGGAGSGAYIVASFFNYAGRYSEKKQVREYREITRGGFYLGPILVALGTIFLIFDLGIPERAYRLFLTTKFTLLTFGSWSILLFFVFALLYILVKSHNDIFIPLFALRILEILAVVAAFCVMTYTGLFISSMPAVPFLNTPIVVILFIVSSLSCGSALITLYGFLNQQKKAMYFGLKIIPRIDTVLIVVEMIVFIVLILQGISVNEVTRKSVDILILGNARILFWVGFVLIGIVVPLALSFLNRRDAQVNLLAISSLAILVGGIALRFCILSSGLHIAFA